MKRIKNYANDHKSGLLFGLVLILSFVSGFVGEKKNQVDMQNEVAKRVNEELNRRLS